MAEAFLQTPITPHTIERLPTVHLVGGKAYGLYWLARHGFEAPPTWTLTTAAFDYVLHQVKLTPKVIALWRALTDAQVDWANTQELLERLEDSRQEIIATLKNLPLIPEISKHLSLLPSKSHWAVRSSANVEDNPRYSFAGQFKSHLYVPASRQRLWEAICDVWTSLFNREALVYCAQRNTLLPKMAVILQPITQITAEYRSGVAFSHSPIPTFPGVLIQAAYGTGYTVVEGLGGDLYSVSGDEVLVYPMRPPRIRVTSPLGFTEEASPPDGLALTEDEARYLADKVRQIAELWRRPVDTEFTWRKGGEPLFVQVRSTAAKR